MLPPELKPKPGGNDSAQREARRDQAIDELTTESDRGCILVGASVLSDFLEEILRAALGTNSHAVKHAIDPLFGPMAPLATFSSRIKLAYGLRLIPKYCFTNLEKIRRIRNVAAHGHSAISFENQEIIGLTRTLEGADYAVRSFQGKKFHTKPQADIGKP